MEFERIQRRLPTTLSDCQRKQFSKVAQDILKWLCPMQDKVLIFMRLIKTYLEVKKIGIYTKNKDRTFSVAG